MTLTLRQNLNQLKRIPKPSHPASLGIEGRSSSCGQTLTNQAQEGCEEGRSSTLEKIRAVYALVSVKSQPQFRLASTLFLPGQVKQRTSYDFLNATGEPNSYSGTANRKATMPNDTASVDADYLALLEDLKNYDNPEAYNDSGHPHLYKLRIISKAFEHLPTILNIDVDGLNLMPVLRECLFGILAQGGGDVREQMIADYEAKDWDEAREMIIADSDYKIAEQDCYWFFVRNFPKLMVKVYELFVLMTVMSVFKSRTFSIEQQRDMEPTIKHFLELGTKDLRNEIKRMLRTRSSGRPKKITTESLPEIVVNVLNVAHEIMGLTRGKDAVPGLKQIADRLNLKENALGKQLVRAKYPWTDIRTHLERLPKIEPGLLADDINAS